MDALMARVAAAESVADQPQRFIDSIERRLKAAGIEGASAEQLFPRLRQSPDGAELWFRLGHLLFGIQWTADAAECYLRAATLRPQDAVARAMYGIALARSGRVQRAEEQLRHAVELDPGRAATHYNLGVALAEQSRFEEAEASLREALRLSQGYGEAHKSLGHVLSSRGRRAEAAEQFRRALELRPDDSDLLGDLGLALALEGRFGDEASVLLKQVARLGTNTPEVFNCLGLAHMAEGRFADAEQSFERALALDPRFASAHSNLGTNYKEQGRLREAMACYDVALRLQPDSVSSHWNRSLALLQAGDYERGWPAYEWRWKRETSPPRRFRQAMWDGSDLQGRSILLWSEQGLGDTVQFIRYARLVRERGGRVIFEYPSPMSEILRSCPGVEHFAAEGEPLPEFDVHMPLMSGPFVFRTSIDTVPRDVPYVRADPQRVARWGEVVRGQHRGRVLRVGIAWQGNPHHPLDRFRSAQLEDFRPLSRVPSVRLFSIQRGPGSEQVDRWKQDLGIVELTRREVVGPEDWADTAAIIANLDLVATVDTAMAHVAGAMAARTWVALAASPDWRWMLRRSDTPWYPTMRLFRQRQLREWGEVFSDMASEVRHLTATFH